MFFTASGVELVMINFPISASLKLEPVWNIGTKAGGSISLEVLAFHLKFNEVMPTASTHRGYSLVGPTTMVQSAPSSLVSILPNASWHPFNIAPSSTWVICSPPGIDRRDSDVV